MFLEVAEETSQRRVPQFQEEVADLEEERKGAGREGWKRGIGKKRKRRILQEQRRNIQNWSKGAIHGSTRELV